MGRKLEVIVATASLLALAGCKGSLDPDYLCKTSVTGIERNSASDKDSFAPQIKLMPAPPGHRKNEIINGFLHVYFQTGQHDLEKNDREDIWSYLGKTYPKSLHLEAHADWRGGDDYNNELSNRRAKSIENFLKPLGYPNLPIKISAYGRSRAQQEGTPVEKLDIDRKVVMIPGEMILERALSLTKSDYLLIDQSGSMNDPLELESLTTAEKIKDAVTGGGASHSKRAKLKDSGYKSKWQRIQGYLESNKLGSQSEVYTFTTNNFVCRDNLKDMHPSGSTPLYWALHQLVEKAQYGKSITVLTDGRDNVGGVYIKDIIDAANKKNISISFVGLGLDEKYQKQLLEIRKATGGAFYFVN